jgi:hypothetical protein
VIRLLTEGRRRERETPEGARTGRPPLSTGCGSRSSASPASPRETAYYQAARKMISAPHSHPKTPEESSSCAQVSAAPSRYWWRGRLWPAWPSSRLPQPQPSPVRRHRGTPALRPPRAPPARPPLQPLQPLQAPPRETMQWAPRSAPTSTRRPHRNRGPGR